MKFEELIEFVEWTLSEAGKGSFVRDQDMIKRVFAQTIKLSEEVGELSAEILGNTGFVRQDKLSRYSQETLNDEIADVIITTFRLARLMDIDIQKALESKINKLKQRVEIG